MSKLPDGIDIHRQYKPSLGEQVNNVEQEARMVLPGIQTLFGFQLIAAFNAGFKHYTHIEQYLHLTSIILVAISGILVVAPAAYHRQAHHQISEHFVKISSNFLTLALAPLALGTCLDIYLVTKIISNSTSIAIITTSILFVLYTGIWFVYPHYRARKLFALPVHEMLNEKN